jgi:hypothetical protein
MRRTCSVVMTAMAILFTLVCVAPASADTTEVLVCANNETVTYTPPLTYLGQDVSVSVNRQFGPCVAPTEPSITAGSSSDSFSAHDRSCFDLLGAGTAEMVVTWNTGAKSTIRENYTANITGVTLTVIATGTVTKGLFEGASTQRELVGPATDILLCTFGLGTVSSVYAAGTLKLIRL